MRPPTPLKKAESAQGSAGEEWGFLLCTHRFSPCHEPATGYAPKEKPLPCSAGFFCWGLVFCLLGLGVFGLWGFFGLLFVGFFVYSLYTNCFNASLQFQSRYACATFKKCFLKIGNIYKLSLQTLPILGRVLKNSRAITTIPAIINFVISYHTEHGTVLYFS